MNCIVISCKCCFLTVLLAITACAYRPRIVTQCIPLQKQCFLTKEPARFSSQEKLIYGASWRGIPSASLVLEIKGIKQVGNRDCYHIVATASPNTFFSFFYNVKYRVETYIDKDNGLSLRFYKKKTFKRKTTEETITFNRDKKTAKCEYNGKQKKDVAIDENTHDLLSFLYYFRLKGLEPEKIYDFSIIFAGKIWPVKMKVNNIYLIKLKNGECMNAFSVTLTSDLINEIMGSSTLDAYVSADIRRTPIYFTAKTRIGESDSVLLNLDCLK